MHMCIYIYIYTCIYVCSAAAAASKRRLAGGLASGRGRRSQICDLANPRNISYSLDSCDLANRETCDLAKYAIYHILFVTLRIANLATLLRMLYIIQ